MKDYYEKLFHTGWFVESILTQTLIVHIIRTRKIPFFQSSPSAVLLMSTLLIMGAGSYLPYSPLANFFGFVPLPAIFWLWIGGFVLCYATLTHFVKAWFFNRYGID
jgi:Mg2+-importing ATPase